MASPHHITVSREGWYYLLVLALVLGGAMICNVNLLLVLAGMLAGPVVFSWRLVGRTLRGLEAKRKVPQGVSAGDLLVVNIGLNNTRRRLGSWAVVVEEQIRRDPAPRRERPIRPSVLFPYIPAGQSRTAAYRGRLLQRGRYQLGPLRLSTRFPFGLFARTVTVEGSDTLMVYPRLGRLTRLWNEQEHEALGAARRIERRQGNEGEFYGVRPWRSGDSRRWIHWRTSARVGGLAVRQFEQPRNPDVAVLIDLWQPQRPQDEHLENVELAVSFAATLVTELCHLSGSKVHLGTTAAEPEFLSGPASAALLREAMERLMMADAGPQDGLPELLERAARDVRSGTEIVLVSTRPNDLGDAARFACLWEDPARRAFAKRIRCVDTSSEELSRFFRMQ